MKKFYLLLVPTLLSSLLFAQQPPQRPAGSWPQAQGPSITGKITGTLIDSLSKKPVEYATVVLLTAKDGKEVNGTVTDEKGQFKLQEVKLGIYKLHLSFLGYDTKTVEKVELTPEKPDFNLSNLYLSPSALLLEEVTVKGEAALVENKVDRIVFNAEKDVTLANGDATDVLRKVPLLSVDLEGNVSLRGSTNIQILINNKPSGMFAGNVADALRMFPADQIKSVEVITAPSAKYDGEGSAGIINIITKKKQLDGFTGSFNLAPGNRQTTSSLNLNAAKGRFGLNGGAFLVYSNPRNGIFDFERHDTLGSQVRTLVQHGKTETARLGSHGNFGAYYDINAYNSLNSNINFRGFGFDRDGNTNATLNDPIANLSQITSRNNLSNTLNTGFDWNTDYRRTFPASDREFSLGFQLSGSQDNADNKLRQNGNLDYLRIDEKSLNISTNLETTLQADYTHPFSKNFKLETGMKGILRTIDSDFHFDTLYSEQSVYLRDASRSDVFDYRQDVYAAYTSLQTNFAEKFGLIAGARYERTHISGDYKFDETKFSNGYWNLLPSAIFSYKTNTFSSARLSYNQRIQRPSLRFINPYTDQQDRNNISYGNPALDPEISHNFELGYNTFVKGIVLNGSLYHRLTNDVIESITRVDETGGFSFTTFDNVGKSKAYGLNLFGSGTLKKIWQLRGNVDVRRIEITANRPNLTQSNTGYEYNANVSSTLSLPGKVKVELWGMLRSPRVTLQGSQATFWMYSLGVQREVFGKRGSLGIRIANLFHRALNFDTKLEGDGFFQNSLFEYPFRSYGLSFNYRFGKLDFREKDRKTKVKNTDQKEGGENNY